MYICTLLLTTILEDKVLEIYRAKYRDSTVEFQLTCAQDYLKEDIGNLHSTSRKILGLNSQEYWKEREASDQT